MAVIKNVAIIGAAGALGEPTLNALVKSSFNVTVLARSTTKGTFPPSVKTVTIDYEDVASITEALRGQDAVVSTVASEAILAQTAVIDAAVAAGVKRFIPSEFGSDLNNPKVTALPVFGHKVVINKYLAEKAAANPKFSYTQVRNGAFLDWGLQYNIFLDWRNDKPRIFDGGDGKFSTTTLASVARAVAGVLEHPDETKNRAVYVQDIVTTQNKILAIAKEVAPEKTKTWELVPTSLEVIKKAADDAVANGQFSFEVMVEYLYCASMGGVYGALMEKTDNELLGVAGDKTDADIEAILKSVL